MSSLDTLGKAGLGQENGLINSWLEELKETGRKK